MPAFLRSATAFVSSTLSVAISIHQPYLGKSVLGFMRGDRGKHQLTVLTRQNVLNVHQDDRRAAFDERMPDDACAVAGIWPSAHTERPRITPVGRPPVRLIGQDRGILLWRQSVRPHSPLD